MASEDRPKKWVECDVSDALKEKVKDWLKNQILGECKPNYDDFHITAIYGFRNSDTDFVNQVLKNVKLPIKIKLGKIRFGHVSPVCLIDVECKELTDLFWKLYPNIKDCPHTLINGKYMAHLTLFWFDKNRSISSFDLTELDYFDGLEYYITAINCKN